MRNQIMILVLLVCCSCMSKRELAYTRYYSGNYLVNVEKDSTFWLQDSWYNISNGSIMGKYRLNEKGKLCLYEFIDRMNFPCTLNAVNNHEENNIVVHIEDSQLTYENIDVYVKKNSIETLLGHLQGVEQSFHYPFHIGDTVQVVFKYERKEGLIVLLKHDSAATKMIVIDSPQKKIEIDFDVFYFDLKNRDEVEEKCFKIRKNRFY